VDYIYIEMIGLKGLNSSAQGTALCESGMRRHVSNTQGFKPIAIEKAATRF